PPGLPADTWGRLIAAGRRSGLETLLDSSGAGLRHALDQGAVPDILKINSRELIDLAAALGASVPAWLAPDDLLPLARFLHGKLGLWARRALIITLGAQGVLAVTEDRPVDGPLDNRNERAVADQVS